MWRPLSPRCMAGAEPTEVRGRLAALFAAPSPTAGGDRTGGGYPAIRGSRRFGSARALGSSETYSAVGPGVGDQDRLRREKPNWLLVTFRSSLPRAQIHMNRRPTERSFEPR
jgi:hypothetical protein